MRFFFKEYYKQPVKMKWLPMTKRIMYFMTKCLISATYFMFLRQVEFFPWKMNFLFLNFHNVYFAVCHRREKFLQIFVKRTVFIFINNLWKLLKYATRSPRGLKYQIYIFCFKIYINYRSFYTLRSRNREDILKCKKLRSSTKVWTVHFGL